MRTPAAPGDSKEAFVRKLSLGWGIWASAAVLVATGCANLKSNQPTENSAIGGAATSRGVPAPEDPTSLSFKGPKPGADLFVASAVVYTQSGNLEAAEGQYKRALEADPDNLSALLGYAKLQDTQHEFGAAEKLYQQAAKKHPKDAAVFNDWGLSYLRRNKLDDATKTLNKAVALQPAKPLYHNNLATVLVESGHPDEAYHQLEAAQPAPVAHYNLGILLHRKGNDELAQRHFELAAQADPTFAPARQWAQQLALRNGQRPATTATRSAVAVTPTVNSSPSMVIDAGAPVAPAMPPEAPPDTTLPVTSAPIAGGPTLSSPESMAPGPTIVSPVEGRAHNAGGAPETAPPVPPEAQLPPLLPELATRQHGPEMGVRYPDPSGQGLAQEGDVPPLPSPLRALPPVSSHAPLPLPPIE